MPRASYFRKAIQSGLADGILTGLYGDRPSSLQIQRGRYSELIRNFSAAFPGGGEVELFSTPGRTEIGGNHTDHNGGHVLAASVDLDAIAAAARVETPVIRIESEGYPPAVIDTRELAPVEAEKYTSAALIRGVCARMEELGYDTGGFQACVTSDVLKGSGLSSSAAFEVLIGTILNHLYNRGTIDPPTLAKVARFAENRYFGKPCGLMDQMTCAVGGFVAIDFADFENPAVKKVDFDFDHRGYALVIVDTGGNHADLNEDYAAVEREMKAVAHALGGQVLRDIPPHKVLEQIDHLRARVSDRAILRSLHFFADDQRVLDEVDALERDEFGRFLELVIASGISSWTYLQNCYSPQAGGRQGIPLALAASENLLKGRGAWRVHGGGFAGTIQAFVPDDQLGSYLDRMRGIFGQAACYKLMVRQSGTTRLEIE
jgi:galactokinase